MYASAIILARIFIPFSGVCIITRSIAVFDSKQVIESVFGQMLQDEAS
jgi:hypothetical protein